MQKDNPNYKVSESGQFAYVIAKAEAKVEINGSYEGTSTAQDAKIYRNAVVDQALHQRLMDILQQLQA
ncbi:hypothetical protein [Lactobacillus gallinarum]|uniref:Uncharacterized protein n=1 Tax=Lactobacillus gallinarum DSM 10532 = JCM 2011 TaxID=1423748 RepID=A0A0R1NKR6_9LACO|nr:hypothetical protein [Lactobacillus gallinarum]KRL20865.1 hypothetical protein FC37_GL001711 [Lactobacillus gallinarum DSM 10532 = JCM 2011]